MDLAPSKLFSRDRGAKPQNGSPTDTKPQNGSPIDTDRAAQSPTASVPSSPTTPVTPVKAFSVDHGDLYLTAEPSGVEFIVHSFFFSRDSPYFKERLETTPWTPRGHLGHPARVLKLTMSEVALDLICKIIYNPTYSHFSFSPGEWMTVLEFAHTYDFEEIKQLALRELEKHPLPHALRIGIYEKQAVNPLLLVPYYFDLCTRSEILSRGEARLIGHEGTLTVFECREISRITIKKGLLLNNQRTNGNNIAEPLFDVNILIEHLSKCLSADPKATRDQLMKTNRIPGPDQPKN